MFEQSVLFTATSHQRWTALVSLTGELAMLMLAILIPIRYSDRLPLVHWKSAAIGPLPLRRIEPKQLEAGHSGEVVIHAITPRIFIDRRIPHPDSHSEVIMEPAIDYTDVSSDLSGGMENNATFTTITSMTIKPPPGLQPEPSPTKQSPSGPVRVSQGVQMAKLIRKVKPEYPALAKSARVYGVVRLLGVIGKNGTVQNLQLISGHPLLAHAALEAVRQWIYNPTLLNGEPVEVMAPIEVNFTLTQ